jgi:DNA processing protein
MEHQERTYQLALSLIKGVGFTVWKKLIDRFGSARALYEDSAGTLKNIFNKGYQPIIQSILNKETLPRAEEIIHVHQQMGMQVLSFFDETYPTRLRHIMNPPCFLYYQGNADLSPSKVISIVGTRKATSYGRSAVAKLIEGFADYGVLVVSGLAFGIDIHAHQLALQHGLPTLGVLASGLDHIYPAAHKSIAEHMLNNGGLVSETPVGSLLENFQFPTRNRLIAGLADATIVVEAGHKSGAIITANFANDYDREVFAIPGNIHEPFSIGCNQLIRTQQAHLVTSVDDIAYMMDWQKTNTDGERLTHLDESQLAGLSSVAKDIIHTLQLVAPKDIHIDDLGQQTKLAPAQLSPVLLQLELKNMVQGLPGSKYKLGSGKLAW